MKKPSEVELVAMVAREKNGYDEVPARGEDLVEIVAMAMNWGVAIGTHPRDHWEVTPEVFKKKRRKDARAFLQALRGGR